MRKLSAYARKIRRQGETAQFYQAAQWLNTIQACRNFSDESPDWSGLAGNVGAANEALLSIRNALDDMLHHRINPDNPEPYELLAHAVDVAHIRYLQIQPTHDNPVTPPLLEAKAALSEMRQRRERTGRWGLAGPERAVLAHAIDLYEEVLLASSPAQMNKAARMRLDGIKAGHFWTAKP